MRLILASAILAASSLSSFAAPPPPEAQKLSEIIAKIEQNPEVQYVHETDWSRRGYYKIEYVRKDGAKVKIKIDPRTGSSVR